jgi:hypothetical protein
MIPTPSTTSPTPTTALTTLSIVFDVLLPDYSVLRVEKELKVNPMMMDEAKSSMLKNLITKARPEGTFSYEIAKIVHPRSTSPHVTDEAHLSFWSMYNIPNLHSNTTFDLSLVMPTTHLVRTAVIPHLSTILPKEVWDDKGKRFKATMDFLVTLKEALRSVSYVEKKSGAAPFQDQFIFVGKKYSFGVSVNGKYLFSFSPIS